MLKDLPICNHIYDFVYDESSLLIQKLQSHEKNMNNPNDNCV